MKTLTVDVCIKIWAEVSIQVDNEQPNHSLTAQQEDQITTVIDSFMSKKKKDMMIIDYRETVAGVRNLKEIDDIL